MIQTALASWTCLSDVCRQNKHNKGSTEQKRDLASADPELLSFTMGLGQENSSCLFE